jgi:hypothetical protein
MGEDAMCEVKATSCADDAKLTPHTRSLAPLWIGVVIVIALALLFKYLKKSK